MKNLTFLVLIILAASVNCFSQEIEYINTDRPDQSDGVYILTKNNIQIEDGITIGKKTYLNNLMVRYGLTKSTEVRFLLDVGQSEGVKGILPVTFSLKQRLIEQNKLIPAITFVGYIAAGPLASNNFNGNDFPTELKLAFENEITDNFAISYNVGTSDWFKDLNFTCNGGFSISNRSSIFLEYFSTFTKNFSQHNIDTGFLYSLTPKFQIDCAFGCSIFDEFDNLFFSCGIGYKI